MVYKNVPYFCIPFCGSFDEHHSSWINLSCSNHHHQLRKITDFILFEWRKNQSSPNMFSASNEIVCRLNISKPILSPLRLNSSLVSILCKFKQSNGIVCTRYSGIWKHSMCGFRWTTIVAMIKHWICAIEKASGGPCWLKSKPHELQTLQFRTRSQKCTYRFWTQLLPFVW